MPTETTRSKRPSSVAVVELAELDQTARRQRLGVFARNAELLGGDVDGGHPRAGGGRDVDGEGSPAGADLGHRHARAQTQLGCRPPQLLRCACSRVSVAGCSNTAQE